MIGHDARMLSVEEVQAYLALGHELRMFEVKGPGSRRDNAYCANVARAAMAMGNLKDGGVICLGIDEAAARLAPAGHIREGDPDQLGRQSSGPAMWGRDDVAAEVAPNLSVEERVLRQSLGDVADELAVRLLNALRETARRA